MKLYLSDQRKHLPKLFSYFQLLDVAEYDRNQLTRKSSEIYITTSINRFEECTNLIFNYQIFPSNILIGLGEWQLQNRTMQTGDTIIQQAYLPPIANFSQKLVFGVRVNKVWNTSDQAGFSYETLEGHPELGESSFEIKKIDLDSIRFQITTFSAPGNFLSRLLTRIFTVPYQSYCTNQALRHVRDQVKLF